MKSLILKKQPLWHVIQGTLRLNSNVPTAAASWILEPGSLTQRLKASFDAPIRVEILQQTASFASVEEALALGIRPGTRLTLREVVLSSGTTPLILARSLLPRSTIQRADRRLWRLGNQPLGEILFSHKTLKRRSLAYTRAVLHSPATDPRPSSWGRRSLYTLGRDAPLLIAEFFLPACLEPVEPECLC